MFHTSKLNVKLIEKKSFKVWTKPQQYFKENLWKSLNKMLSSKGLLNEKELWLNYQK